MSNRVFMALACVACIVGAGTISYSAGSRGAQVVRAQKFELLDSKGKVRAALATVNDAPTLLMFGPSAQISIVDDSGTVRLGMAAEPGRGAIMLADSKGNVRVALSVDDNGAALLFTDDKGTVRAGLSQHKKPSDRGLSGLSLHDEKGTERLSASLLDGGEATLVISDERSTQRVQLGAVKGSPFLSLADQKGTARMWQGLLRGHPVAKLADEKGGRRAIMQLLPNGQPSLAFFDERDTLRTLAGAGQAPGALETSGSESSLVLFNRMGGVQWAAP